MARPAYERVGAAFRQAYEAAGLRQTDVADALDVDPATVSKWSRGLQRIDLEYFPVIDQLCRRPRGYLLRLAGYVDDEQTDTRAAIEADPVLTEPVRAMLLDVYDSALRRLSAPQTPSKASDSASMAAAR